MNSETHTCFNVPLTEEQIDLIIIALTEFKRRFDEDPLNNEETDDISQLITYLEDGLEFGLLLA